MTSDHSLLIVAPDSNVTPTDKILESLLEELLVPQDFQGWGGKLKARGISMLNAYNPLHMIDKIQGKELKPSERAIYLDTMKPLLLYLMRRLYQVDLPRMMPEALVVSPDDKRLRDFQCSDDHFLSNVVYVRHPAASTYFLRVAEFHEKLLDEKRSEFLQLLTSLGAKRINLIDKNQQGKSGSTSAKIDDPTSIADVKAEAKMEHIFSSELKVDGEFDLPTIPPRVPDGLKWLKKESSWQTIVHGRQNGNWMKKYNVSFTYTQNFGITSNVVAKLEGFGVSIGGNFSNMKTIEQEYFVEFYSPEDYENKRRWK
ncbi:MAG: hypothetical protein KME60_22615 [Cyanomargarita calcarea GSE-NOS-MK-12-04C]|jgi:hypothetical protein|uniref:Uncharacterized protein n=1 Tax=Cyanomargarita calcarea GSE-NOS-MK-12-04C TaxID=2839659 RepID=A0A951UUK2_9CYAN|nr:hypothetical protein [Cyanomargarita calcarea GSE-NOS-MK-12-04C]